ncbi:MAG: phage major capsid protein [Bacteroidetes bacterium]|nr:phage major capsid protein [Bacteroidota bacterium]
MKIKLKTEGLAGEDLAFVERLNTRFAEQPESIVKDDLIAELRTAGIVGEDGKPTADFAKIKEILGEGDSSVRSILKAQGEAINSLKEKNQPEDLSTRGQISKWQEANKEAISKIKLGVKADLQPLELRVAATMTKAGVGSITLPALSVDGINDLVRKQPTFYDYLSKGRTNQASFAWVNKSNKQGAAAFIGEGILKPLASFDITTEVSNAKKVAERMKASMELLEDIEGMQTLIEQELEYEVKMAVNTALLTGVASSTVPAGITTVSTAFTTTTVKTTAPNNMDAIRAAKAQLNSLNFNGNIVAFVNPIDAANMDITKASTSGVYMLQGPNGVNVAGVPIVEDNNIAVGYLLLVDLDKYKVLIYKDFTIAWGWENDDFSKNLVTVIGEMRLHQYYSLNNAGAFIYDTFANIKTAITAP